jgi:hypothetical protein
MGVRGIMSLLREGMTSYGSRFEMIERGNVDGQQHDNAATAEVPVLVVDGSSFVYWLCQEKMGYQSALCTDYGVLSQLVGDWVTKCSRCGIRCVFVFDGPTPPDKLHTKFKRIRQQCCDMSNFINGSSHDLKNIPPCLSFNCVIETLQALGVVVHIAEAEADSELLYRAYLLSSERNTIEPPESNTSSKRQKVIGILSADSDIMLTSVIAGSTLDSPQSFYGLVPCWAFDFHSDARTGILSVVGYVFHAARLCTVLFGESRVYLLPLMAVLLGNDTSKSVELRQIHEQMRTHLTKFPKLAAVRAALCSRKISTSIAVAAANKKAKTSSQIMLPPVPNVTVEVSCLIRAQETCVEPISIDELVADAMRESQLPSPGASSSSSSSSRRSSLNAFYASAAKTVKVC